VPLEIIKKGGLDIQPPNFTQAQQDQQQFTKNEAGESSGMSLDIWTNKGDESLVFTQGESMQVFLRMNAPGYVRLLYHLADGTRALLLDNYYISPAMANKVQQIPQDFECAAPYGAEVLQVIASDKEIPRAETRKIDGYDILVEDLAKYQASTRGMIKSKKSGKLVEQTLQITTMAR
jgi:hypothetical protein